MYLVKYIILKAEYEMEKQWSKLKSERIQELKDKIKDLELQNLLLAKEMERRKNK